MQCRVCSSAVDTHGLFPGGAVRCISCGADNQVPSGRTPAISDPYRRPEPPAPQPTVAHASAALGPLCPRCPRLLLDDPERSGLSCAACGGVFLVHATLATRIDAERPVDKPAHPPRHASQAQRESAVHYAWCPECRQTMARMNFGGHSGIVVDVCRAHGTWFDRGELEAALDFVRAGGIEEDLATAPPADEA
ncbi:MAG TPA: zf-TFIIB domain-containing protein, partial [Polyangiaceae bacterium]